MIKELKAWLGVEPYNIKRRIIFACACVLIGGFVVFFTIFGAFGVTLLLYERMGVSEEVRSLLLRMMVVSTIVIVIYISSILAVIYYFLARSK
jgi:uncharacterized BrkB/YihY/UPF0761 family membrane protein